MEALNKAEATSHDEISNTLDLDLKNDIITSEYQVSDEVNNKKSDLCDFNNQALLSSDVPNLSNIDHANVERQNITLKYNSTVSSNSKPGRLHLLIRYDNERSKLIVEILDFEDLVVPKQENAFVVCLEFTLIGPYSDENSTEKFTRILVENVAKEKKDPMEFCTTLEYATKQNLYVNAANASLETSLDREVRKIISKRNNKMIDLLLFF